MLKTLLPALLLVFTCVTAHSESRTIRRDIRDSSGKPMYQNTTRGNISETRDANGRLLMRSKTNDGATEFRDSSGRLIQRIKNR